MHFFVQIFHLGFNFYLNISGAVSRKPLYKKSPAVENLEKFNVKSLFNVNNHTPKQLRHYKYTIVTFLSALLSSLPFVNQVQYLIYYYYDQR